MITVPLKAATSSFHTTPEAWQKMHLYNELQSGADLTFANDPEHLFLMLQMLLVADVALQSLQSLNSTFLLKCWLSHATTQFWVDCSVRRGFEAKRWLNAKDANITLVYSSLKQFYTFRTPQHFAKPRNFWLLYWHCLMSDWKYYILPVHRDPAFFHTATGSE